MPRRPYSHAYRDAEGEPSLVTCGIYFFALVILGAIVTYLILKILGML